MNFEIKKDLASNWFKTLQDAFCDNICKLEKNKKKNGLLKIKKCNILNEVDIQSSICYMIEEQNLDYRQVGMLREY